MREKLKPPIIIVAIIIPLVAIVVGLWCIKEFLKTILKFKIAQQLSYVEDLLCANIEYISCHNITYGACPLALENALKCYLKEKRNITEKIEFAEVDGRKVPVEYTPVSVHATKCMCVLNWENTTWCKFVVEMLVIHAKSISTIKEDVYEWVKLWEEWDICKNVTVKYYRESDMEETYRISCDVYIPKYIPLPPSLS